MNDIFSSIDCLIEHIKSKNYIIDRQFATILYISYHIGKPLLLSGPAGVGKTEIANVMSQLISDSDPIRLQCYEGIDENKAIFDFDYRKQLLYIESNRGDKSFNDIEGDIYSEKFLIARPLLKSILSEQQSVLLIDEIDKADEEFEPLLLEVLSSFQVSIPEIGTLKAKTKPLVILTSNDSRELSDALKRRCCFYYIDYPTVEREIEIVLTHIPHINTLLATQVVNYVHSVRKESLKKSPSISETIDWVKSLISMDINDLNNKDVQDTLNVLLKNQSDITLIKSKNKKILESLPKLPQINIQDNNSKQKNIEKQKDKLSKKDIWDF